MDARSFPFNPTKPIANIKQAEEVSSSIWFSQSVLLFLQGVLQFQTTPACIFSSCCAFPCIDSNCSIRHRRRIEDLVTGEELYQFVQSRSAYEIGKQKDKIRKMLRSIYCQTLQSVPTCPLRIQLYRKDNIIVSKRHS